MKIIPFTIVSKTHMAFPVLPGEDPVGEGKSE
jgi:hypothetical protein